ncbi:MAG: hypothetical protein ACODAQ_07390 [Phycisphaeraceae bacterium]
MHRSNLLTWSTAIACALAVGFSAWAQDLGQPQEEGQQEQQAPAAAASEQEQETTVRGTVIDLQTYLDLTAEQQAQAGSEAPFEDVDWSEDKHAQAVENGVPVAILEEQDDGQVAIGGPPAAYVISFDPENSDGEEAHETLTESVGEFVEATGEAHNANAFRGLRALEVQEAEKADESE